MKVDFQPQRNNLSERRVSAVSETGGRHRKGPPAHVPAGVGFVAGRRDEPEGRAPPTRRAPLPDSARRVPRTRFGCPSGGYSASGASPPSARARSTRPGVRSSPAGSSSSTPNASMRARASSPSARRRRPSAPSSTRSPGARRRARASSRARPHGRLRGRDARARRARPDAGVRGARSRRWGRGAAGGVAPRGQPNRVRGTRRAESGSGARRVGGACPSDPSRRPATNPTPAGTCAGGPFRCLPAVSLTAETRRSLRLFR